MGSHIRNILMWSDSKLYKFSMSVFLKIIFGNVFVVVNCTNLEVLVENIVQNVIQIC